MCWINCRDTTEPRDMPSSTRTAWVTWAGTLNGRPARAAAPTAIMAPEIRPPGRLAHRNSRPPAPPIASVSSTISALLRLGRATAIDEGIRLTPPYGKSASEGQMRQREPAMHGRPRASQLCSTTGRRDAPARWWNMTKPLRLRLGGGVLAGLLALGHELLALLAMEALGVGILGALHRRRAARLLGLLFRRHLRCRRGGRRRRLRHGRTHQEQGCDGGNGRAGGKGHHGRHLGLKRGATSRHNAEPRMNEAGSRGVSGARYFTAPIVRSVVTRRRGVRMGDYRAMPKETKGMTIQAKLLCTLAVTGFA